MKQIILIISILIIIIGGAIYASTYITKTSNELTGKLEELKQQINSDDEDKAKQKANEIYDNWEKVSKGWSIIVLHNELDLIETSLVSMKANIETGEKNKAIEDLDKSVDLLNHIVEKETLSLKNIF